MNLSENKKRIIIELIEKELALKNHGSSRRKKLESIRHRMAASVKTAKNLNVK